METLYGDEAWRPASNRVGSGGKAPSSHSGQGAIQQLCERRIVPGSPNRSRSSPRWYQVIRCRRPIGFVWRFLPASDPTRWRAGREIGFVRQERGGIARRTPGPADWVRSERNRRLRRALPDMVNLASFRRCSRFDGRLTGFPPPIKDQIRTDANRGFVRSGSEGPALGRMVPPLRSGESGRHRPGGWHRAHGAPRGFDRPGAIMFEIGFDRSRTTRIRDGRDVSLPEREKGCRRPRANCQRAHPYNRDLIDRRPGIPLAYFAFEITATVAAVARR